MHRRFAVAALGAVLMLSAVPDPGIAQDIYERPLVLPVPEDAEVEVKQDLIYKQVNNKQLGMDVYLPGDRNPDARLPAVVFIHGGPVESLPGPPKDASVYTSYGRLVAASGLAAVTFSHRFMNGAALPNAAQDVADALTYVREHAAQLSLDPGRICVWAESAGGVFVAPLLQERPAYLRCIVLFYTNVDPATFEELGLEGVPEDFAAKYDATEAVAASGDSLPRIVVARAGRDFKPLNRALDQFLAAAIDANAPVDLMNHPQGEHAFNVLNDDKRSREIIRRSLEIVRSVLSDQHP